MADGRAARLISSIEALEAELRLNPGDALAQLSLLRALFLTAEQRQASYTRGLRLSTQLTAQSGELIWQAYKAAFTAIGGRYTPWPLEQFNRVSDAALQFDPLVERNPEHAELRFLRGAVYDKLPAIMLKSRQAEADLTRLGQLLEVDRPELPAEFSTEMARYVAQCARVPHSLRQRVATRYNV